MAKAVVYIDMIDEERLRYVGSMVLGLNDALVELTGALAGLTLALQNTRLVAMTGLITGVAGSLSMAASEYLSTKSEGGVKEPFRASVYTGFAYVLTVIFLILPYLLLIDLYSKAVSRDGVDKPWSSSFNIRYRIYYQDIFEHRNINYKILS